MATNSPLQGPQHLQDFLPSLRCLLHVLNFESKNLLRENACCCRANAETATSNVLSRAYTFVLDFSGTISAKMGLHKRENNTIKNHCQRSITTGWPVALQGCRHASLDFTIPIALQSGHRECMDQLLLATIHRHT